MNSLTASMRFEENIREIIMVTKIKGVVCIIFEFQKILINTQECYSDFLYFYIGKLE
ncbi:hypothetical protein AGMMS49579_26850 [Spirochaetia bacterium]|nr:hypothetical protein AGMMS49579_26850 [Spirochaetia bacterium]